MINQQAYQLKAILKQAVGKPLISVAEAFPAVRPAMKHLGLRTTEKLFGPREVTIPMPSGQPLKLTHLSDNYLSFQVFWRGIGYYEPITGLVLQELAKPDHTFIDIGANVGLFSLMVSHARPGIKVIAFEPNPKLVGILQANVVANGFEQIRCEPVALSDRDGTARLFLHESDMSASLLSDFQRESNSREDSTEVQTVSLDSYLSRHSVRPPLVVKVDVEGHEEAFLEGAKQTIATHKPDLILEVLKDFSTASISMLKTAGYRFYPITDQGLVESPELRSVPPKPFYFFNHLVSAKAKSEVAAIFRRIEEKVRKINLYETSKYQPSRSLVVLLAIATRWNSELLNLCSPLQAFG